MKVGSRAGEAPGRDVPNLAATPRKQELVTIHVLKQMIQNMVCHHVVPDPCPDNPRNHNSLSAAANSVWAPMAHHQSQHFLGLGLETFIAYDQDHKVQLWSFMISSHLQPLLRPASSPS